MIALCCFDILSTRREDERGRNPRENCQSIVWVFLLLASRISSAPIGRLVAHAFCKDVLLWRMWASMTLSPIEKGREREKKIGVGDVAR
jgi:hypothetical protein